jgi:hypothetical protein
LTQERLVETREEYQNRTELKLNELESKIWMVQGKADQMTHEAKAEHIELFQVLYLKLELVSEGLQELEEASEETWEDLRARVDGALSDLNNSVGNVLSRMG